MSDHGADGGGTSAQRIGPFVAGPWIHEIPGASFGWATSADGRGVLLQVAYVRAPEPGEVAARDDELRRLEVSTSTCIAHRVVPVVAHGHRLLDDGRALVFWALEGDRWDPTDSALPLTSPPEDVGGWMALARGGVARLRARHAVGLRAPLLLETNLHVAKVGDLDGFGVPIVVAAQWVGPGTLSPRRAPSEGAITKEEGDLWRLARVLLSSSAPIGPELMRWVEGLHRGRYPTAEVASRELEACLPTPPHLVSDGVSHEGYAPPPDRGLSLLEQAAVQDVAITWSQPPMSTTESPWSDLGPQVAAEPDVDSGIHQAPASAPTPETAERRPQRRGAMAVVALGVFGLLALWARPAAQGSDAASSVRLNTIPSGALVLSARDGRVLGRAPLEFLVPAGASASVVVAHEGHLPEVRAVNEDDMLIELEAASGPPCDPSVSSSPEIVWRGPGFAVVRPTERSGEVGARVVACAEGEAPVFAAPLEPHWISFHGPAGQALQVEGEWAKVPHSVRTRRAFVRLSWLGRSAIWVPAMADAVVRLPRDPHGARPGPTLEGTLGQLGPRTH